MQLTFVFSFNAAYLREGIQGWLPNWEQRPGGRRVRSRGKRGDKTCSQASLTQGFGSWAKKTSGCTTGALSQGGSVRLRGSHARCPAESQPAQHPSAGVGHQVSLESGRLPMVAAHSSSSLLYFLLPHLSLLPSVKGHVKGHVCSHQKRWEEIQACFTLVVFWRDRFSISSVYLFPHEENHVCLSNFSPQVKATDFLLAHCWSAGQFS